MFRVQIGSYDIRDGVLILVQDGENDTPVDDVDLARIVASQQLDKWWDSLLLEVNQHKFKLHNQSLRVELNGALLLKEDAAIEDVDDVTVVIAIDDVPAVASQFKRECRLAGQKWDASLASIIAASTVPELIVVIQSLI